MSVHEKMNFETKQAIKNAFIQQVEEVGFERVTVKNLALVAEINRGTFYLHYSDKYDVMEDLQQELLKELERYVKHVQPLDAFQTLKMGQLYQPFIKVITCIKEHAPAFRMLLGEQGSPSFTQKVKMIFGSHILDRLSLIRKEAPRSRVSTILTSLYSICHFGGHSGVVGQGERELNGRRNGRSTFSINTFFRKCSRYYLMKTATALDL